MLQIFRLIAFLEGLSYILLLFIATPLKYLNDTPIYVKNFRMPHGVFSHTICSFHFVVEKWYEMEHKANCFYFISLSSALCYFYVDFKYLRNK